MLTGRIADWGELRDMKTQLLKYFEAAHNRSELRMHKRWQRIRRIGQGWFITCCIAGFWLFMVADFFYIAWSFDPSLNLLHRLRPDAYQVMIGFVASFSVILYIALRYTWREYERKYRR